MITQGIKINEWGKNVYVKVPVVNSKPIYRKSYKRVEQQKYKIKYHCSLFFKSNQKILNKLNKKPRQLFLYLLEEQVTQAMIQFRI